MIKILLPIALAVLICMPGHAATIGAPIYATSYPGADIGAQVNAAEAACVAAHAETCGIIVTPNPTNAGVWDYSTTMAFGIPTHLQCTPGTTLNYSGTGNAATLGPAGLTNSTFQTYPYTVQGCIFSGGSAAAEGLFFNNYVTQVNVWDTVFHNFGNSRSWNIWLQGSNWDVRIDRVQMWDDSSGGTFNGIYTNSDGDHGQSQVHVTNTLIQNNAAGAGAGTGIFLNGFSAVLDALTITGMEPEVRIGYQGSQSYLTNVYMETPNGGPACITFGDEPSDNGGSLLDYYPSGVVLKNIVCDVHNTDFHTTSYFMSPTGTGDGLSGFVFEDISVENLTPGNELVRENNFGSQGGNIMNRYMGATHLHTTGSNISSWSGSVLGPVN
jgi:hypothetical protein